MEIDEVRSVALYAGDILTDGLDRRIQLLFAPPSDENERSFLNKELSRS
jgi:hypothetical protein